ncbi:MAG: hypothetical protein KDK70_09440 [Myxococcales bacterium]|nr:hypothetical protein [Myxococcales bacterium]
MRHPLASSTPWILCSLVALAAPGCREDEPGPDGADTDASTGTGTTEGADTTGTTGDAVDSTGSEALVTYWQDVAPVLYDSCVTCHRAGGIGPFALETYDDATAWSVAIASSVQNRTMPPWLVVDDGTCGDFRHSRWLPDETLDLIAAWVDDGTPEGEPRDDLTIPEPVDLGDATEIQTPNFVPEIQGGKLAEFDEYRCFLVDPQLPADRFLTGYDVRPGNDAIVHHVLVMPVDPDLAVGMGQTNADVMQALDDESPDRDGWPCFGEAGEGVETSGIPVVWAPGQGVVEFPEGTGLRIGASEQLVIQVHYNLANAGNIGMSDQSTVRLRLEDQVDREGFMLLPDPFLESIFEGDPIELPPGEPSVEYTWDLPIAALLAWVSLDSIDLFGVFPHMHQYGQAMHMTIENGGELECAADVPRWDFGWQLQYFYEQPHTLTDADTLHVTCDFDTVGADGPVLPGWGTHNEMCLMGLYVVP